MVRAGLEPSDVRYVSASEVQVRIPQFPQYDITRPETIVLTIPAACMRNNPTAIENAASFELHAVSYPYPYPCPCPYPYPYPYPHPYPYPYPYPYLYPYPRRPSGPPWSRSSPSPR